MTEKRWATIASSIRIAIQRGELASGARVASEVEMANQWNVSPVTVHRALAELQREGWVTRRRSGTVVAERPTHPSPKIALVFTTLSDKPQGAYLSGIEESLAEGYQLLPMATYDALKEAKCLRRAAAECSAVICYPIGAPENTPLLNEIAGSMPLVLVDRIPEGVEADAVMTDNFGSMLMGLKHLQTLGHRRIAYFMDERAPISSVRERHAAYLQFMQREIGLDDPTRWERRFSPLTIPWDQILNQVATTVAELLSETEPVTAIACEQDGDMSALLESCAHLNVRVPDDLAILSFQDTSTRQPLVRSVHRLVQRAEEMGHMAARRVHQRLTMQPSSPAQITRLLADLYPATRLNLSPLAQKFAARKKVV
jgi:GntR family transcriptional regulator of arabinose operon